MWVSTGGSRGDGGRVPQRRERRRGLIVVLGTSFLMWGGFFMVVPLLSVHYVDGLGWAAGSIGVVLGVRQVVQQGLTVAGGALADRLGAKGLIVAGLLLRAAGFVWTARAETFSALLAATVLGAVGGALFEAPLAAGVVALTEEAERSRFFALQGVVSGLGMTIGPLVGAVLLGIDFAVVALTAAGCYLVCAGVTLVLLPTIRLATERRGLGHGLWLAMRDRPFVLFNGFLMGYWFMWVQLTISLPLAATAIAGTTAAVSWVYALNAGMSVLFQYPLVRLAERWLRPLPILVLGLAIMAVGLAGVAVAGGVASLLGCVALFSVGSLLATPSQKTVAAELANPAALGSYFGVGALALALGGGVGNVGGGVLYGLGRRWDAPALPWLVFAAVGLGVAAGLWRLDRARAVSPATPRAIPEASAVRGRR